MSSAASRRQSKRRTTVARDSLASPPKDAVVPPLGRSDSVAIRQQNAEAAALLAANPRSPNDGGVWTYDYEEYVNATFGVRGGRGVEVISGVGISFAGPYGAGSSRALTLPLPRSLNTLRSSTTVATVTVPIPSCVN